MIMRINEYYTCKEHKIDKNGQEIIEQHGSPLMTEDGRFIDNYKDAMNQAFRDVHNTIENFETKKILLTVYYPEGNRLFAVAGKNVNGQAQTHVVF